MLLASGIICMVLELELCMGMSKLVRRTADCLKKMVAKVREKYSVIFLLSSVEFSTKCGRMKSEIPRRSSAFLSFV